MYLTLREAADMLRVDPETLRKKFIAQKVPGAFRTDGEKGSWRISREDFDAWMKARQVNG